MTGFGKSIFESEQYKISVEIRSLNSKSLDLNLRIPTRYKEKELEVRKVISDELIRGKIDVVIQFETLQNIKNNQINSSIVKNYIEDLKLIQPEISEIEALKIAMRLPEILQNSEQLIEENEWNVLFEVLKKAIFQLNEFRQTEGIVIKNELHKNILNIENQLVELIQYEKERVERIKNKFQNNLEELKISVDENRLHQELIFYVEKLDISEEKVRLKQHLNYFTEIITNELNSGKKLGFITQEIGREINTIGSKANHHEIQKIVVKMKDDLEKIKEQIFNII